MQIEECPAPIHLGAFPCDPGFPQLEVACDAVRMREAFRRHLKPACDRSVAILECTPFRFRCHQSSGRCVLQYTLRLGGQDSGPERCVWVTGLIYADPGEAERVWRRMCVADPVREIAEEWRTFEPVSFIPELDMVVEVFPYDRRLPQLPRVMNGATRDLGRMLLAGLGPGRWQPSDPTLEAMRYRTEMGAVLRYALPAREAESGRSESPSCYLKVYRDERGHETWDFLKQWAGRAREPRGYSLVRPLAYWSELRTLVLEEAPGVSLRDALAGGADPFATVKAVARAVAAFNQDDLAISRTHSVADQRSSLNAASALVQWACPLKRAKVAGVTAVVKRYLEEVPPAPIHRDLTTDHVMVSGERVILIDADSVALGDPVRDPAFLYAHIANAAGDAPSSDAPSPIATAFAEEYFAHVPATWRRRFRYQCAGAFIEVAAGIFRSQQPGWPERVMETAAKARHALVGEFG